jgi:hypothetical protein
MAPEEIWEATTKKTLAILKMRVPRWQAQTPHLTLNPKQIRKGQCGDEPALLWLGPFRPRRRLPATSFNGSLECIRSRHLRPRRPAAGAEQHDEPLVRTTAAKPSQFAYDHSTISIL